MASTPGRFESDSGGPDESDTNDSEASTRFDIGGWFRDTFFDESGPTRKLLAAVAVLIVAIVIVVYILMQGGDGDGSGGDNTVTPTATTPSVVSSDRTGTPTSEGRATPPGQSGRQTPEPSPTAGVNQGGDNQRD